MVLSALRDGQSAIVKQIKLNQKNTSRLFYLGVYKGCRIQRLQSAPMGDPVLYWVGSIQLVICHMEASKIVVEVVE